MNQFKDKVLKSVIWIAIQNWGEQFGSLLIFFTLARLLDPESFGLVALANVFLAFIYIFLNQGFPKALIQKENIEPEHIDTAFWTNIISGCILAGLCIAFSPAISNIFEQPDLTPVLRCFSLLIIISSLNDIQEALLERQFKFKSVTLRSLISLLISGIVGVALAFKGFGVWSLVAQQLIYATVGVIVIWQASDWRPRMRFSWRHFCELFDFGINILAFNFLGFVNTRSDDLLIGYFLGPTALGYYSIAYRILKIMIQLLIDTVNRVALPTFSRLQADLNMFRKAFYKATQFTSLIAFPCFLGVAILAPKIIPLMFGEQWFPAASVLQFLSLAGMFSAITRFKGAIFIAMGKPSWRVWIGLLSSVINIALFAIAVRWGIAAVGAAYLTRTIIMFPIEQGAVGKLINVPLQTYLSRFSATLFSALIMGAVILVVQMVLVIEKNVLLEVILLSLTGAAAYTLLIRFLAPSLFQEVMTIVLPLLPMVKNRDA